MTDVAVQIARLELEAWIARAAYIRRACERETRIARNVARSQAVVEHQRMRFALSALDQALARARADLHAHAVPSSSAVRSLTEVVRFCESELRSVRDG